MFFKFIKNFKADLPIEDRLYISEDKVFAITCNNSSMFVQMDKPSFLEGFTGVLDLKKIRKVISNYSDYIEVVDDKIKFHDKDMSMSLGKIDDDFSTALALRPDIDYQYSCKFSLKDFLNAVDFTQGSVAVAKGKRIYLNSYYLDTREGKQGIITTNGWSLSHHPLEISVTKLKETIGLNGVNTPVADLNGFNIPSVTVDFLVKLATKKYDTGIEIKFTDDKFVITFNEIEIFGETPGVFPNWEQVLPKEVNYSMVISDRGVMGSWVGALKKLTQHKKNGLIVRLEPKKDKNEFYITVDEPDFVKEWGISEVKFPAKINGDVPTLFLNAYYLLNVLKMETVRVDVISSLGVVKFEDLDNSERYALLMPCKDT